MSSWTTCPGCGLELPASRTQPDHRVNASGECLQVCAEVAGFASEHRQLLRWHQLTVDAYGAQHGGGGARPIRLAYSLVGLHLALDRELSGDEVRAGHQRMGKPDPSWPDFLPPPDSWGSTVMTVAEQGLMAGSAAGHSNAVQRWAADVWRAWATQHGAVVALTAKLLPDLVG